VTHATHPQSDYLSVADVARALGLSRMTVYRMCQSGALEHIRTGRGGKTYRIARSSYEQHTTPAPAGDDGAREPGPGQQAITI
jgi:excisionase family DNA binding protein